MPNPNIKSLGIDDTHIHCMVVGAPGFGKTVFAGTAAKGLFLTTDPEGTVSALAMGSTCKEWRITSWTELNEAYRYLRDGGIEADGWDFVIIDNIGEAQNLGMKETMEIARKNKPGLDEFVPTQQDYQRSQLMMKEMVKRFHDLPVHIIWTAWRVTRSNDDGDLLYAPGIHGQEGYLAETIAGYMNIVGYGEVVEKNGKEVRRIHFNQLAPWQGKDRFITLGKYRDNFTVPEMKTLVETAMRKYKRTSSSATKPAARRAAPATTKSSGTPARRTALRRSK